MVIDIVIRNLDILEKWKIPLGYFLTSTILEVHLKILYVSIGENKTDVLTVDEIIAHYFKPIIKPNINGLDRMLCKYDRHESVLRKFIR